jgi:hypothetical protein
MNKPLKKFNQVLVASLFRLPANVHEEIGRYVDVTPLSGQKIAPNTVAEFFDKKGAKVIGKVFINEFGDTIVDTFI